MKNAVYLGLTFYGCLAFAGLLASLPRLRRNKAPSNVVPFPDRSNVRRIDVKREVRG
jgi:hypothetical protein